MKKPPFPKNTTLRQERELLREVIPIEINKLRGLIFSRHRSLREFSDAIGWQKKKTSRIMLGIQEPTLKDVKEIAVHFNLSRQEFLELFFEGVFGGGNK